MSIIWMAIRKLQLIFINLDNCFINDKKYLIN